MKKIIIMMIAVAAAATAARAEVVMIDFSGMNLSAASFAMADDIEINFDGGRAPKAAVAAPRPARAERVERAFIPARVFDPAEEAELNKSIGSAIAYVKAHGKSEEFALSFECLLKTGTAQQKFDFVYQPEGSVYTFPSACVSGEKGICDWVVENVCRTITVVSCAWVTSGDNPPITKKECRDEAKEDCKEVKNWVCS